MKTLKYDLVFSFFSYLILVKPVKTKDPLYNIW
jgi:hypothetical protein